MRRKPRAYAFRLGKRLRSGWLAVPLFPCVFLASVLPVPAAGPQSTVAPGKLSLTVEVVDDNKVAVPDAQVILTDAAGRTVEKSATDDAGRCEFQGLSGGSYSLRVAKEGFYELVESEVHVGETESVEVTLNHEQEFSESVNVIYSPPAIDLEHTSSSEQLNSTQIIDLPYPVPRDIRYALPLLPGVLQDAFGRLHVDGSSTRQIVDRLDGFNITDAGTGDFDLRLSVDALRSVEVETSRYPAEFGKGSGGLINFSTGMGDDRFRYSGTDFIPSLQNRRGLHINSWTPRGTLSGPIVRGKGWFLLAPEGEYNVNIFTQLPPGADRNTFWRFGNLAKAQVNWRPAQILTGTLLVNRLGAPREGLSRFDPVETTVNARESAYLLSVKNQSLLANGTLFELGFAASRLRVTGTPQGNQTYVITPDTARGNFFEASARMAGRKQFIANLVPPAVKRGGRHQLKFGTDLDRLTSHQSFVRHPFQILREDGTLARQVSFNGNPSFERDNFEASVYAEDRWSVSDRLLIEPGVRIDWDEVVRQALVSPRLASSVMLTRDGETKLTWGAGLYYDASTLEYISRPDTGQRVDLFYDATGQTLLFPPLTTTLSANDRHVQAPRFLNWSVALDRKLPRSVYASVEYIQKRGHNGWTYLDLPSPNPPNPNEPSGNFVFSNSRRDRYDAVEVKARRRFQGDHVVFAAYTRSAARSNAVLNFTLDNPLFSPQVAGPFAWDAPNRFQSWGIVPLVKKVDLAYSTDLRDGFPFFLVNQEQELVAPPGARRFPAYFTLNLFLERRLVLFGYQWALRVGLNDVTNRHNPFAVDNNVDSPHFLAFSAIDGRSLTARIRLLGRK